MGSPCGGFDSASSLNPSVAKVQGLARWGNAGKGYRRRDAHFIIELFLADLDDLGITCDRVDGMVDSIVL